jgi:hypothetical protein
MKDLGHSRGLRVSARRSHPIVGDGVSLNSSEHPYTVRGWDAFGKPMVEIIEIAPSRPKHPILYFLMRLTPWWAWNVWYRLGFTKMRMITKIVPLSADSLVTEQLSLPSRDTTGA